jgi:hypothetical protein
MGMHDGVAVGGLLTMAAAACAAFWCAAVHATGQACEQKHECWLPDAEY